MKHPRTVHTAPVSKDEWLVSHLMATGRFFPVSPLTGQQQTQLIRINVGGFAYAIGREYNRFDYDELYIDYCCVRLSETLVHELSHWGTYHDDMNPPEWNIIADCSWWDKAILFRVAYLSDEVLN